MAYIRDHARFSILDDVPADVWQEPTTHDTGTDPDRYLCIVSEEPHDYDGSFTACVFSEALYQREHVGVSVECLKTCTPAPEPVARKVLASYLRQWANIEDEETAALLLDDAERIASAPVFNAMREARETAHATAESITYTSGKHGKGWTAAPGFGACIYQMQPGRLYAYFAVCGEIWRPTTFDAVCLVNTRRMTFASREAARKWAHEQAAAHGYPIQTARPAYDLFTI